MRELSLRLTIGLSISVVALAVFFFIGQWVRADESVQQFDRWIIAYAQSLHGDAMTSLMKVFTFLGEALTIAMFSVVVTIFLFFYLRQIPQTMLFISVIIATGVFNQILKYIYQRPRPEFFRLAEASGYSFPSGHTMIAFSFYMTVAYIAWRQLKTEATRFAFFSLAAVIVVLIGFSRIYLGVHFPSDILGGIFASSVIVIVATTIYDWYQRKMENKLTFAPHLRS